MPVAHGIRSGRIWPRWGCRLWVTACMARVIRCRFLCTMRGWCVRDLRPPVCLAGSTRCQVPHAKPPPHGSHGLQRDVWREIVRGGHGALRPVLCQGPFFFFSSSLFLNACQRVLRGPQNRPRQPLGRGCSSCIAWCCLESRHPGPWSVRPSERAQEGRAQR